MKYIQVTYKLCNQQWPAEELHFSEDNIKTSWLLNCMLILWDFTCQDNPDLFLNYYKLDKLNLMKSVACSQLDVLVYGGSQCWSGQLEKETWLQISHTKHVLSSISCPFLASLFPFKELWILINIFPLFKLVSSIILLIILIDFKTNCELLIYWILKTYFWFML